MGSFADSDSPRHGRRPDLPRGQPPTSPDRMNAKTRGKMWQNSPPPHESTSPPARSIASHKGSADRTKFSAVAASTPSTAHTSATITRRVSAGRSASESRSTVKRYARPDASVLICRDSGLDWRPGRVYFLTLLEPLARTTGLWPLPPGRPVPATVYLPRWDDERFTAHAAKRVQLADDVSELNWMFCARCKSLGHDPWREQSRRSRSCAVAPLVTVRHDRWRASHSR
jgi:hypothetical protein